MPIWRQRSPPCSDIYCEPWSEWWTTPRSGVEDVRSPSRARRRRARLRKLGRIDQRTIPAALTVHDRGEVEPAPDRAHALNVGTPGPDRCRRLEVAVDEVSATLTPGTRILVQQYRPH